MHKMMKSVPIQLESPGKSTLDGEQNTNNRQMYSQSMLPEISSENIIYHPIASNDIRARQKNMNKKQSRSLLGGAVTPSRTTSQ